jgi:hypothetical protein
LNEGSDRRADERVLHDLLGAVRIAREARGDRVDAPVMSR